MPQARKSTRSSSRRSVTFKEPAALKRLTTSLDSAQKALKELGTHAGKTSAQSTRNLHKDLGKFLTSAKRDSGKFATSLKKDFDQAQKTLKKAPASRSSRAGAKSTRSSTTRTTTRRTTRKTS